MKEKITMKITEDSHKKLQLAKAHMGSKTFSDVIEELAGRYLEMLISRGR
jgi:predicted CopG family antitoxin